MQTLVYHVASTIDVYVAKEEDTVPASLNYDKLAANFASAVALAAVLAFWC